jgi:hypothetical protein
MRAFDPLPSGYGEYGQLANGQTTNILDEPLEYASDALIGSLAIYISAGFYHTCAVLESLDVVCWGTSRDRASNSYPSPFE